MSSWAIWYRNLFVAWVIIGLPGLVIGYGMSGGELELPGRGADVLSVVVWLAAAAFIFSPAILWRWRTRGRKQGF